MTLLGGKTFGTTCTNSAAAVRPLRSSESPWFTKNNFVYAFSVDQLFSWIRNVNRCNCNLKIDKSFSCLLNNFIPQFDRSFSTKSKNFFLKFNWYFHRILSLLNKNLGIKLQQQKASSTVNDGSFTLEHTFFFFGTRFGSNGGGSFQPPG